MSSTKMSVSVEEFEAMKAELNALKQKVTKEDEGSDEVEPEDEGQMEGVTVKRAVNYQIALRRIMSLNIKQASDKDYLLWSFIPSHYKQNYRQFQIGERDEEHFVVKAKLPNLFVSIRFDGHTDGARFLANKATVSFKGEEVAVCSFTANSE